MFAVLSLLLLGSDAEAGSLKKLQAYERARHNPRHFKRVSLNVLVREDDGRSFTEIEALTYVLQPELMAAEFSCPSSAYPTPRPRARRPAAVAGVSA